MGIFLSLSISKAVSKEEWEMVYKETLQLAKDLKLAEKRKILCRDIETACLVLVEEHEMDSWWQNVDKRIGWCVDGDYRTMRTAEAFFMPKNLVKDDAVKQDAGDAMLAAIPYYMQVDGEDKKYEQTYEIWGNKTQGEPYHIYLLAIACTIEARLKEKAFVDGDITRGQCKLAVHFANMYLKEPIDLPDRCDMSRLHERVSKLPLSDNEKINVFESLYLGTKDEEFGAYLRKVYSKSVCEEYWRDRICHINISNFVFGKTVKKFLGWGFELGDLCKLVNFYDTNNEPQYEAFVNTILETKMYIKDKDCKDVLEIDQEASGTYSVYTQFAQSLFGGAYNKKVNRYMSIDEIRTTLIQCIGENCDVNLVIDEYLKKETEANNAEKDNYSEIFQDYVNTGTKALAKNREKYDIADYEDLINYRTNKTINPNLKKAVTESFKFYNSILEDKQYKELLSKSADERCRWLVKRNTNLLFRELDWKKIFNDIHEKEENFSRYYPMVCVETNTQGLIDVVTSFVLNDELYKYLSKLIEE